MHPYLAIVSARIRMLLQYRAAALGGMSTQLFWGLIRVMVFEAFYRSSTASQPMTYPEVVNYVWLGQALFAMLPWSIDQEIRGKIRDGSVAYELVRPLDLYSFWFSRALGDPPCPHRVALGTHTDYCSALQCFFSTCSCPPLPPRPVPGS
jgi:ABC-2 type transport system permease protein